MSEYTIPINDLFVRSSVPLGIPGLATDELRIAFIQATAPVPRRSTEDLGRSSLLYHTN